MKTYVINLGRRKDRLELMSAQLRQLGITFKRIAAFDSVAVEHAWLSRHFTARGPLGVIPKGDQCCSLSHRRAWATFLASHEPYAIILEDDALLDPAAAGLLQSLEWLPSDVDLLKLEHFGPESQRVLLGEAAEVAAGRFIAPIRSRHTGAAAYILSRNAAKLLVSLDGKWPLPVDHMLFNANVSGIAALLRALSAAARYRAPERRVRCLRYRAVTANNEKAHLLLHEARTSARLLRVKAFAIADCAGAEWQGPADRSAGTLRRVTGGAVLPRRRSPDC